MSHPEDLLSLSLSLSQPLPTDHYTSDIFNLSRTGLEPPLANQLARTGTPGTSGDDGRLGSGSGTSSGVDGKKKAKKKKRKVGELVQGIPEDVKDPVAPVSVKEIQAEPGSLQAVEVVPVRPSPFDTQPVVPDPQEDPESDLENVQKESIIVEPWENTEPSHDEEKRKISSEIVLNDEPRQRTSPDISPRRATPLPVRRPAPTILDQFPTLRNIPNLIPSALPIPSMRDVKAAGRTTHRAGMALVGTVKEEYRTRVIGRTEGGVQEDKVQRGKHVRLRDEQLGARQRRKTTTHRRPGSELSLDSDGHSSASAGTSDEALREEDRFEDDSEDEVLIDVDDAEGMAETWKGVAGVDEAALGVGWMKWRSCKWEQVRLGGADERRLLVTLNPSPQTALQVIDCTVVDSRNSPFTTPLNMLHPETVDLANSTVLQTAPFEVLHLPRHRPGRRRGEGDTEDEPVINAFFHAEVEVMDGVDAAPGDLDISEDDEEILVDCALWRCVERDAAGSPMKWIFLTLLKRQAKGHRTYGERPAASEEHSVFLSLFDTRSSRVERKMLIGKGRAGQVVSSDACLIVTIAGQESSIHFLSPTTLKPKLRPVTTNIGLNSRTGLPVVSLSGRLFAYVSTDRRPQQPVQRGFQDTRLGTIVTATSNQASQSRTQQADQVIPFDQPLQRLRPETSPGTSPSMQSIVLNTAAGLGSEMARGMWTGLKGLSSAAIQGASQSETLSKSAPALSSLAQKYAGAKQNGQTLPPNHGRNSTPTEAIYTATSFSSHQSRFAAGSWAKIMDLGGRQTEVPGCKSDKLSHDRSQDKKLRKARVIAHFALPASDVISVPHAAIGTPTIDAISFAPGGTTLALSTTDGRSSFIVEIRPAVFGVMERHMIEGQPEGEVWGRYELRRGVTPAVVEKIEWSACGAWIGIGTRRTIHVFAIHPSGGRASALQIKSPRPVNLDYLPPLSVRVSPALRVRRPRGILKTQAKASVPPSPEKGDAAADTLIPWKLSACRIPARVFFFGPPIPPATDNAQPKKEFSGVLRTLNVFDPTKRILRSEAVYIASGEQGSARKTGQGDIVEDVKLASSTFRAWKVPTEPYQLFVSGDTSGTDSVARKGKAISFAHAEIHTYSTSGKVLPRPIYRENWLKFSSIGSGEDGLPIRYQFRVTVDAAAPGEEGVGADFNQPLTYAIQSHLDFQQSLPIIPALPNGAGREASRWHSPIGAFAHAKDIVRMRRKDSSQTNTSGTPGTTPASYGDHLVVDGELFEAGGAGNEPDDMTTGSTSGDTRDDEWDDDLVTGVMDDELHHTNARPHGKGVEAKSSR